jgi:hypothetical protein
MSACVWELPRWRYRELPKTTRLHIWRQFRQEWYLKTRTDHSCRPIRQREQRCIPPPGQAIKQHLLKTFELVSSTSPQITPPLRKQKKGGPKPILLLLLPSWPRQPKLCQLFRACVGNGATNRAALRNITPFEGVFWRILRFRRFPAASL